MKVERKKKTERERERFVMRKNGDQAAIWNRIKGGKDDIFAERE
jgi:hypothetical protein